MAKRKQTKVEEAYRTLKKARPLIEHRWVGGYWGLDADGHLLEDNESLANAVRVCSLGAIGKVMGITGDDAAYTCAAEFLKHGIAVSHPDDYPPDEDSQEIDTSDVGIADFNDSFGHDSVKLAWDAAIKIAHAAFKAERAKRRARARAR